MGLPAQEEHIPDRLPGARLAGRREEGAKPVLRVREKRQDRHGEEPRGHSRLHQLCHGLDPEIGPGARGSMRLKRAASIEASETLMMRSLRFAISVSSSTSLTMPADFVVMPTRSPGTRTMASST